MQTAAGPSPAARSVAESQRPDNRAFPAQPRRRAPRRASPRITGTIGLWAGSRPSAAVNRRAFSSGLRRSASSPFKIRSAAAAAATDAGGRPVENIRLRARFSRNAITSARARRSRLSSRRLSRACPFADQPARPSRALDHGHRRSRARHHGRGRARPARQPERSRRPC